MFETSKVTIAAAAPPEDEWALFRGGQGAEAPAGCLSPRDPGRAAPRGASATNPGAFEEVADCVLGGTASVPPGTAWSFWAPVSLRPLTGFLDGRLALGAAYEAPRVPDASGTLDARLEAGDLGVVLVQALPSRPDDPWVGKGDLAEAGDLDEVLAALNPQLAPNVVRAEADVYDGVSYYTYELRNARTSYRNRRTIKLVLAGAALLAIDARCDEAQWARAAPVHNALVASFRIGEQAARSPFPA